MKKKAENRWIIKGNKDKIKDYLETADFIVIERKRLIQLLIDIFSYHFKTKEGLKIIDIGCGDGIVTKHLSESFPENDFTLLDGSREMIEKVKMRFKTQNFHCIHQNFTEFISKNKPLNRYHFIYSSMAIHHLQFPEKKQLFRKIYQALENGGLFLNIDTILPNSKLSEKWQFFMWRDWMRRNLEENGFMEKNKYNYIPDKYKQNKENVPSKLVQQLHALQDVGFKNVDCFFKYGIIALFGGTRDNAN